MRLTSSLSALIEQGRQSDGPDAQKLADYREINLLLLRKARESDIPTAWAWFEESYLTERP